MCVAIPTQIKEIDEHRMATVELGGVARRVSLTMTPEAQVGDYVLVHTGYAINVLSPDDAQETLQMFAEIAAIEAEMTQD